MRLRVGLLTPGFSASEADWCIPAQLDLVRALGERDDLRVFALRYPHARARYDVHGAQVQAFGAAQRRGLGRALMWARVLWALRRAHRERAFDVLHALWAHEPGFLATLAGRALRVPVVVSLLGGELEDLADIDYGGRRSPLNRRLVPFALRRAARVTVGSLFLRERCRQARRWDARSCVWPLGVDTARFHPRGSRDEERARARATRALALDGDPAVLCVASLVPVKDHATLLRAFARLRADRPTARLHLVGEGDGRAAVERLARDLGVAAGVTFHGHVPHERLADVYRQADLCVLSSRFESQGVAPLEAVACGCPVAGTAVGTLPELTAHVSAPGDAEALAAALARALDAPTPASLPERFRLASSVTALREVYTEVRAASR